MTKNRSALPRSRSYTTTSSEMAHMTSRGRSILSRGILRPRTWRFAMASSSRFSDRNPARKMTTSTFEISPGWKENRPKKFTHSWLPPDSKPTKMGSSSNATPKMPKVYL